MDGTVGVTVSGCHHDIITVSLMPLLSPWCHVCNDVTMVQRDVIMANMMPFQ